jgi:hypothetical protein
MKNGQSRHMGNNWNNTQNADAQSKTLNTVSFNNNTDPICNRKIAERGKIDIHDTNT